MKYYVILQPTIKSIGGEELFTRNLVISAREHGYVPIVLHCGTGDNIYIEDLKQYEKNSFKELLYDPNVFSESRKKRFLDKISALLPDSDEDTIVESHEILVAEWGELIAQRIKARHFAYMLLEHNVLCNKSLYNFFRFKYERHELAGFEPQIIPEMFINFDKNIFGYSILAFCRNSVENISFPQQFKIDKGDFTIGTIGRTDKKYVQPMVDSIINFANSHKEKIINILYIGGSMNKTSEKNVISKFSSISNINFFFTGLIFPIAADLIKQMDVCLASTESCYISDNCGIPTICIDGNDSKAIGILNHTTKNVLFRSSDEPPIDIECLLEDVLIEKKYLPEDRLNIEPLDFDEYWAFVNAIVSPLEYYEISNIKLTKKEKIKNLILGYYYGLSKKSFTSIVLSQIFRIFYK